MREIVLLDGDHLLDVLASGLQIRITGLGIIYDYLTQIR